MDWAHRPQVPGREGADLPQGPRDIPAPGWLQEVMPGSWGFQQGLWGAGWGADPQLLLGTSLKAPVCGLLSSPAGVAWASSCPPIPVWGLLKHRTPSPPPQAPTPKDGSPSWPSRAHPLAQPRGWKSFFPGHSRGSSGQSQPRSTHGPGTHFVRLQAVPGGAVPGAGPALGRGAARASG